MVVVWWFFEYAYILLKNILTQIKYFVGLVTPNYWLGTLALAEIEATHVAHEVSNGKNFFEEAGKSAITLGVTTATTGVLGAIGAKHLGPTGSLAGISAGALIGAITNSIMD